MRPIFSWVLHYQTPGADVRTMVVEAATKAWAICGAVLALEEEGHREVAILSCAVLPTQPTAVLS